MTRTENEILWEAFDNLELVASYSTRSKTPDQLTLDAIGMRIIAGVESLAKLPDERRDELFGDSWAQMRAMRNRLVHGYEFVDSSIVIRTALEEVPQVMSIIATVLDN